MYIHIYIYTYVYIYTHIYICIYVYIYSRLTSVKCGLCVSPRKRPETAASSAAVVCCTESHEVLIAFNLKGLTAVAADL